MPLRDKPIMDRIDSPAAPEEIRGSCQIALLVSLSCVLQISESLIPHPIPGLRLGLANLVTLVALVLLGFRPALEIALLRTLLSSLMMGTFMSPAFILSFCGALISTVVMGLLFQVSRYRRRYGFSIIGISIVGALTHNMIQLALAYLLLVRHSGIFLFFPWLCYGAVGMGWLTGAVAAGVCRRIESNDSPDPSSVLIQQGDTSSFSFTRYQAHTGFLHRMSPEIKISVILLLALVVLVFSSFQLFLGLFLFLALLIALSRTSPGFLVHHIRRYKILVLMAFLLPLFFNSGDRILFAYGAVSITSEGFTTGSLFALRILFLILLSGLLMRTTSPAQLTRGLSRLLYPLKILGVSEQRTAEILTLSWTAVPVLWEAARHALRRSDISTAGRIRHLVPLLSDFIAGLYVETRPDSALWTSVRDHREPATARASASDQPDIPR